MRVGQDEIQRDEVDPEEELQGAEDSNDDSAADDHQNAISRGGGVAGSGEPGEGVGGGGGPSTVI